MATSTTGAELKRFYSDDAYWSKEAKGNCYHEDEVLTVDGVAQPEAQRGIEHIPDAANVTVEGGYVFCDAWDSRSAPSFEEFFVRWRQAQSTRTLVVEVPSDRVSEITNAVRGLGGTVRG